MQFHAIQIDPIITKALEEDWGYGDWTTDLCVPSDKISQARLIAKEDLMVAGIDLARAVFLKVDPDLKVTLHVENGKMVKNRDLLMEVHGRARSILKAERVALNLFMKMCGIATLSRRYVDALDGTKTQLLDTRKTTPGLRILEKAATMIGGARNHRFGLCDGVMIKENHIRAAGGISKACAMVMESLPPTLKIEVECTTIAEMEEAIRAGADIVMLDNMPVDEMKKAVQIAAGRVLLEASGNVRLDNVREVASSGVDFISTSAVITSARWADISLLFDI